MDHCGFLCAVDGNVMRKEDEKILNYSPLAKEIRKIHRVSTKIVPVVVGALGVVSERPSSAHSLKLLVRSRD